MNITINLDLASIISSAISAERITPIVDKAISEAVKGAINEATGYNSPFRAELKRLLSEVMAHGLSIDDTAKFQHIMNQALSEAVKGANAEAVSTAMRETIKSIMPDVPDRIKLSDLMREARSGLSLGSGREPIFARLNMRDFGGGTIAFDRDEGCTSIYRAMILLSFSGDGRVYSLQLDGIDITPKSMPTSIGRFDGILLSMYVGRTSLEIDIDEFNVERLASEQ